MTARDTILASIRRSLGVTGQEAPRRKAVANRLKEHPRGVVPARGQLPPAERVALFRAMVEAAAGTVEDIPRAGDVPGAVAGFLRCRWRFAVVPIRGSPPCRGIRSAHWR
jgi:L-lactate dehydrogenase complex protein LldG